jgi:Ca-activated chloride channel family protein
VRSNSAIPLIIHLALFAPLIAGLASCTQLPGKLRIIEGGFHHARGHYLDAIEVYREALDYPAAAPYAEYGLGVIYLTLNEDEEAANHFEAAARFLDNEAEFPPSEHRELRCRIHYNTGIIHFQRGDYAAAAAGFRRALEADGSNIDAKRNLELSLLSPDRRNQDNSSLNKASKTFGGGDILFDYIRQKEREKWKSRAWAADESPSGPDY